MSRFSRLSNQIKEEVKQASIIIKDEENKCFIENFSIKLNENNFSDERINLKIKHKNEDVWESNCSPGEITEMLVQTDSNFDQNESIFLYLESENFASQWHRLEKIGKKLIFKDGKNIVLYRKRYAILEYEFYKGTDTNFRGREPNFKGVEILGHWESLPGFGRDWQVWQKSGRWSLG